MCNHGTPGRSFPQTDIFKHRGSGHTPEEVLNGYMAPTCSVHTNGAGGGHGYVPCIGLQSTETGNQYGGVAHRAAVHGERNRAGVSRVERFHISTLYHIYTRTPSSL